MQTFQIEEEKDFDPKFDKLLYNLLNVRSFETHILECNDLQRGNHQITGTNNIKNKKQSKVDCNSGVLHIPSIHILSELDDKATVDKTLISKQLEQTYRPYRNGLNVSWFHDCALHDVPKSTCVLQREFPVNTNDDDDDVHDDVCNSNDNDTNNTTITSTCGIKEEVPPTACFRGIHDGIIANHEIRQIIQLGKYMVSQGGDHLTIYQDTSALNEIIPSVLRKLETLLQSKYATPKITPVAFQVSLTFPITYTSTSKKIAKGTNKALLIEARNDTIYKTWFNQIQFINSWPRFAIPMQTPYRDQCLLVSDLEANKNFAFHTSVYLSDGAGEDFSGGMSLFVDNHESNLDPRKKIQRGVAIDGSQGRIVVNSGGEDNLRCRLPLRSGIRAELNIWWNCIN